MEQNEPSLLDQQVAPEEPRSKRRKFIIAFVAIILFVLALLIGNHYYAYYKVIWANEEYAQAVKDNAAKELAAKMADTYGGKSPAETLTMYIDAVKKGDYELASKYFIERNRNQGFSDLKMMTSETIQQFINLLGETLTSEGSYSWDKKQFGFDRPITIDLTLYPNGIWKIIEI